MSKTLRLGRMFRSDGRTVICAMDHPRMLFVPQVPPLGPLVSALAAEGCDGFLCNAGQLDAVAPHLGRASLIVAVRVGVNPRCIVEQCLRAGADGVKAEIFPGLPGAEQAFKDLEHLALTCEKWGLIVVGEMVPGGFDAPQEHTASNLAMAARQAAECGVDVVKLPMVTSGELSEVVAYSSVPVTILGGSASPDFPSVVRLAMRAGASGVIAGRFIFSDPEPRARLVDLIRLVHTS